MNNKVFYQHPNLMRALGMHETVMEVMVNVLGGGGDSKVTVMIFSLFCLSILFSVTSLIERLVGHLSYTLQPFFSLFASRRLDSPKW